MNEVRKSIHKAASRVKKSEFNRNVITLVFGTSLAQLFTFALYPVVSRLYSPHDFGVFGVFLSVAGIITLVSTARYELAIILPDEDIRAYHILRLSFLINFFVSLATLLIVTVVVLTNIKLPEEYIEIHKLLFLIPLFILFSGASNIFQNWFIRKRQFRLLSISKIITSLSNNLLVVLLGFLSAGIWGLVAGVFVSTILVVFYFFLKYRGVITQFNSSFSRTVMKSEAAKFVDFPKANSLHALSDYIQNQGVIYFLAVFFSSGTVGLYAFAMRILQAPVMLIVSSFAQVFYQKASEMNNKKQPLFILLRNTSLKMLLMSIPVLLILLLFGADLFSFIFSDKWRESGIYASILAPWICLDFVRYSIAQMPVVLGKLKQIFVWSLIGNVIIVTIMVSGNFFLYEIHKTLTFLSLFMSFYILLQIAWIFKITRNADNR